MAKKYNAVIIVLAVLLAASVLSLAGFWIHSAFNKADPVDAVVPDNLITSEPSESQDNSQSEAADSADNAVSADNTALNSTVSDNGTAENSGVTARGLYLHTKNPDDNTPFAVKNMFPGDIETKYFCIRVAHKADVTVRYHADIRPGYEKLAEVLKCRVELLTTGEVLYDGLMRDMPESLNHKLSTAKATESELYYRIDAYLETSVGNEYQLKELVADFRWWVEETDSLIVPQTGDSFKTVSVVIAAVSLAMLILLFLLRKRKEGDEHA